jgi:hypothetical protein
MPKWEEDNPDNLSVTALIWQQQRPFAVPLKGVLRTALIIASRKSFLNTGILQH